MPSHKICAALMVLISIAALPTVSICADQVDSSQGIIIPDLQPYCSRDRLTSRETTVYIDTSSLAPATDASELVKSIEHSSLGAREFVRVIVIHSSTEAHQVFYNCWPDLSAKEIEKSGDDQPTGIWGQILAVLNRSEHSKIKDAQDLFEEQLTGALDKELRLVNGDLQPVDMLQLLSLEKSRLSDDSRLNRILIFSKLDSPIIRERFSGNESTDLQAKLEQLHRDYALDFGLGDIWVLGNRSGDQKTEPPIKEKIWTAIFQMGRGNLRSISSELPPQDDGQFGAPERFVGTWTAADKSGTAELRFSTAKDNGALHFAWIIVKSPPLYLPIVVNGTIDCSETHSCKMQNGQVFLDVPLLRSTPYFKAGDLVEFDIPENGNADGVLKPPGKSRISGTDVPLLYQFKLHRQ